MSDVELDPYDLRILDALQRNGSIGNAALSEIVHLSASQCSRRRAALERSGVIEGYRACLSAAKLGQKLRAIVRLNITKHEHEANETLSKWMAGQPEIQSAFSLSGDADYLLMVRVTDLEAFSDFVHSKLLRQPLVAQVRSEIVLKTLKDSPVLQLKGI